MKIHTLVDGKYFVQSRIKSGEMVSAYRVWHSSWEKYLTVEISNKTMGKGTPEFLEMRKQGRQWVELGVHPNLIAGYFLREIEERLWLFLQPVYGKSLAELPHREEFHKILAIALEIANGMEYLHGEGMVHGNLKLDSVIFSRDGRIRIGNIRWDYWNGLKMLTRGMRCSTYDNLDPLLLRKQANTRLAYRPPEYFLEDVKENSAFDIYAFGVLLYELWNRKLPLYYRDEELENLFFAYTRGHRNGEIDSCSFELLPQEIALLVRQCMERLPENRPDSFAQIKNALEEIYRNKIGKDYIFERWDENTLLAMSLNNRALSHIDSGEEEKAEKILREVSELDSRRGAAILNMNLLKLRCKKLSVMEFFQNMEKYKALEPLKALLLQGQACLEFGSLVCEAFKKISMPFDEESLALLRANFHYRRHDYQQARDGYRACANTSQGNQDLWYRLGGASLALKLYEETPHAWEFGMRQPLPLWDLVVAYSMLLAMQGQWAKARVCLDSAASGLTNYLKTPVPVSPWSQIKKLGAKGMAPVLEVSASQSDDTIYCWSGDGKCRQWLWPSGKKLPTMDLAPAGKKLSGGTVPNISGTSVAHEVFKAVTTHGDKLVRVWDIRKGKLLFELKGHFAPVTGVAVSPRGKIAVSGSMDKTVKLWDINRGVCISTLKGHRDCINCVAISYDCSIAVSGGWDKTVYVWDLLHKDLLCTLKGHQGEITALAISVDGRMVISGDTLPTAQIWDISCKQRIAKLEGHSRKINSVYISDSGRLAISGSEDGTVCVYEDIAQRACPCWSQANYQLDCLPAASPLSKRQKLAKMENRVREFLRKKQIGPALKSYREMTESLTLAPCEILQELSTEATKQGFCPEKLNRYTSAAVLVGESDIAAFVCTSQGPLFCMSKNGSFRRWNWQDGRIDTFWQKSSLGNKAIAYVDNGNKIFCFGGKDKMLYLWKPDCDYWADMEGHSGDISCICITHDGKFAITGDSSGSVQIWNLRRECLIAEWKAHPKMVTDIGLTPDGKFAITSSLEGDICSWKLPAQKPAVQGQKKVGPILCIAIPESGENFVVSGALDGTLKQWNLSSGFPYNITKAHKTAITAACIRQQGDIVLFGGQDGVLKLWSLSARKCLAELPVHRGPVTQVYMSADASHIFSTARDNTLKVHSIEWEWREIS